MERMSSLDAVFLAVEDPVDQMNLGTVAIFEGPAPSFEDVRAFAAAKIQSVPRCRQRVRMASGLFGRPVWIDDVNFDLDDHLQRASLPGTTASVLEEFVADVMAQPLDRRRALWEMWFVDGLVDDRWAIVAKVHHCVVDGIAGTDLLTAIMDAEPDAEPIAPKPWSPAPEPSPCQITRFNAVMAWNSAIAHFRGAVASLVHPYRSLVHLRNLFVGAKRLWHGSPLPNSSLTGSIGPNRRWARARVPFDDVTAIRHAFGGTVNDVVVASVTGAFRELLLTRGETVDGRKVAALVPVSLRTPEEHGLPGNRIADVHALLPVGIADPVASLLTIQEHLDDLKNSHEVDASGAVMRLGDLAPRAIVDRVARAVVRQANVETAVTNVPGPRTPLFCCGRQMLEGYPFAPIAGHVRISVAVWSYCDHISFGVTGDRDTATDLSRFVGGIETRFAQLLNAATDTTSR
jgi:diacylglycerol O-acyltransferase